MKHLRLVGLMSLVLAFVAASGCSTIYFHNGPTRTFPEYSEWHHDGIFGLVEFSSPVNMAEKCQGKPWETIRMEEPFVQGFVRVITYSLYDPWEVAYSCRE